MDPATDPGLEEVVAERFDAADGPCRGPLAGFAAAGLNDATGPGTGLGVATRKAPPVKVSRKAGINRRSTARADGLRFEPPKRRPIRPGDRGGKNDGGDRVLPSPWWGRWRPEAQEVGGLGARPGLAVVAAGDAGDGGPLSLKDRRSRGWI